MTANCKLTNLGGQTLVLVLFNECVLCGRGNSDNELPSSKEWI